MTTPPTTSGCAAGTRRTIGARAGFTLIEMLVVVVILGIMAGVASMAPASRGEQDLALAQVQIADAMQRAASLARSQRLPHGVVFDLAADRFAIVAEGGVPATDPVTRRAYIVEFDRPNQPLVDVTAAVFGAAGAAALFDAQGIPLTGGQVTLSCAGHTRTLVLDAATGELSSP